RGSTGSRRWIAHRARAGPSGHRRICEDRHGGSRRLPLARAGATRHRGAVRGGAMDLNADLGEGMDDGSILPFLTSASIACGMHAGGPLVMQRTVAQALSRGVRIGAHPGYPDRENFGRTAMDLSLDEVRALVLYQIGALDAFARARGGHLSHVKAHGALYNRAPRHPPLPPAIPQAVPPHAR